MDLEDVTADAVIRWTAESLLGWCDIDCSYYTVEGEACYLAGRTPGSEELMCYHDGRPLLTCIPNYLKDADADGLVREKIKSLGEQNAQAVVVSQYVWMLWETRLPKHISNHCLGVIKQYKPGDWTVACFAEAHKFSPFRVAEKVQ